MAIKGARHHLQDSRALRQRLCGALRMQLRVMEGVGGNGCGEAVALECRLLEAALKELLVPGIVPAAPDELRHVVAVAAREMQELPALRQRNGAIVPRVQAVVEPDPGPTPGPTPEPAASHSDLSGWRLSMARRRGLVTA